MVQVDKVAKGKKINEIDNSIESHILLINDEEENITNPILFSFIKNMENTDLSALSTKEKAKLTRFKDQIIEGKDTIGQWIAKVVGAIVGAGTAVGTGPIYDSSFFT